MTVAVTRKELGAGDLRGEARRCRDGAASRRMLAPALVLEGSPRRKRRGTPAWTGRRSGTGCTATTPCMDDPRSARVFSAKRGTLGANC